MSTILQPFYDAIAWLIVHIHSLLSHVFDPNGGASWALSIVLLTLVMRILLIPLFVKQIKSQRAMTALQPQIKALQKKYKDDKAKLNEEMMKLWKEAGVNPFMGCLPLLPQLPIFFALFHTMDSLRPSLVTSSGAACSTASATCRYGFQKVGEFGAYVKPKGAFSPSQALVVHAANAKVFGVPISAAFSSPSSILTFLHASATSTRILAGVLTVLMVATTFLTQRQMLARNAANNPDNPMASQQKMLLYALPLIFLFSGYRFPIGVLLYWLTTNVWSLGQQFIVLRRMDAATVAATPAPSEAPSGPAPGAKPVRAKGPTPVTPARILPADGDAAATPPVRRPPPGPNANKRRRKRRR